MKTFRRLSIVTSVFALMLLPAAQAASARQAQHSVTASRPSFKLTKRERNRALAPSLKLSLAGSLGSRAMSPRTKIRREVSSSSTLISGTAVSGAGRWPNAHVGVYAWNGSSWVWQGYVATANSAGNYSFYEPSGYYYYVLGEESYRCSYSGGENLWGNSASFPANGGKVNAQVTQNSVTYYGTGC